MIEVAYGENVLFQISRSNAQRDVVVDYISQCRNKTAALEGNVHFEHTNALMILITKI